MRILICGAGTTGSHVADVLAAAHDVSVVDRRPDRRPSDARWRFYPGDATLPGTLLRAGAAEADAVIAVTRDDATNALIALLAKRRFHVATTVARVVDPRHAWLFTAAAGVDVAVSSAELVARLVQEEVTAGDLVTLLRVRTGGVAVTETVIPPGAAVAGTPVAEIGLPDGVAITAVVRGPSLLLPARAGRLRAGDVVVALCEPGCEPLLHQALTRQAAAPGAGAAR